MTTKPNPSGGLVRRFSGVLAVVLASFVGGLLAARLRRAASVTDDARLPGATKGHPGDPGAPAPGSAPEAESAARVEADERPRPAPARTSSGSTPPASGLVLPRATRAPRGGDELVVGLAFPDIVRPTGVYRGDASGAHLGLWRCVDEAARRLTSPWDGSPYPYRVVPLLPDGDVDGQVESIDVLVVGGTRLTTSGYPIRWVKDLIAGAVRLGIPVGAVCYGHHLAAQVLAGFGVVSSLDYEHGSFAHHARTPLLVRENSLCHAAGLRVGTCLHWQGVSELAVAQTAIEVTAIAATGRSDGERFVEGCEVREANVYTIQSHPEEAGEPGIEWFRLILAIARDIRHGCLGQTPDTAWHGRPYGRLLPPPTDVGK